MAVLGTTPSVLVTAGVYKHQPAAVAFSLCVGLQWGQSDIPAGHVNWMIQWYVSPSGVLQHQTGPVRLDLSSGWIYGVTIPQVFCNTGQST